MDTYSAIDPSDEPLYDQVKRALEMTGAFDLRERLGLSARIAEAASDDDLRGMLANATRSRDALLGALEDGIDNNSPRVINTVKFTNEGWVEIPWTVNRGTAEVLLASYRGSIQTLREEIERRNARVTA